VGLGAVGGTGAATGFAGITLDGSAEGFVARFFGVGMIQTPVSRVAKLHQLQGRDTDSGRTGFQYNTLSGQCQEQNH